MVAEPPVGRLLLITTALFGFVARAGDCLPELTAWHAGLDFEAMEDSLRQEPPLFSTNAAQYLRYGLGRPSYQGSARIQYIEFDRAGGAIFRPDPFNQPGAAQAEVAGYRFSRRLGLKLVPPTVRRCLRGVCGSVQYFVDTPFDLTQSRQRKRARALMSEKNRADKIAYQFVIGRWDDTWSNSNIDAVGEPALFDLEDILILQQIQYGGFPFLRRYRHHREIGERPLPSTPFPFDAVRELKSPYDPEFWLHFARHLDLDPLRMMEGRAERGEFMARPLRFVEWDQSVWIYWNQENRLPLHTEVYSRATLEKLAALTLAEVEIDFPPPFTSRHHHFLLERRDQFLRAARSGRLID